jgi:hypothetical protein
MAADPSSPGTQAPFLGMKRSQWYGLCGVALFCAILALGSGGDHSVEPDGESYRAIAQGHLDQASRPFSSRPLHPWVAFGVSKLFHLTTSDAFLAVGVLTLAVTLAFLVRFIYEYSPESGLTLFTPIPLLFAPWLTLLYKYYEQPDLFHAMLAAAFLWTFARRPWLSLPILFALFMARESTLLLSIAVVIVAVLWRRVGLAVSTTLISLAGIAVNSYVARLSKPNPHHLDGLLYLAAKVLHQGAYNLFGLAFLVDKHAYYNQFTPKYVFHLPHWAMLGGVRELAFIGFDAGAPLSVLVAYLCTFGILPTLLLYHFRRRGRSWSREMPIEGRIAVIYGALCFVTAPILGNAIARYLTYAWPLFLIAAPWLLAFRFALNRKTRVWLAPIHLAVCWGPVALAPMVKTAPIAGLSLTVVIAIALHYLCLRLLKAAPVSGVEGGRYVTIAAEGL